MMPLLPQQWQPRGRASLLLLLLTCLCAAPLAAQKLTLTLLPNDTTRVQITDLPVRLPYNADTSIFKDITPFYSFLYVFGDGNFVNRTRDFSALNRYVVPVDTTTEVQASVYATGKYSDEKDPPPKRLDTLIVGKGGKQVSTDYTKGGALFLQKNHGQLVPEKTTVWILTLRNPKKVGSISGMVYLFHDSPVEELFISKSPSPPDTTKVPSVKGGVAQYGHFDYQHALFHFPEVYPRTYGINNVPGGPLSQAYKKALVWQITNLAPGMERHLFIEIRNDSLLLEKFSPENLGSFKFMAMFVANNDEGDDDEEDNISVLTPAKQERVNQLGLPAFLANADSLLGLLTPMDSFPPGTEFPFPEFTPSTQIVDFVEVNTLGSRSNDPNYIRIESCTCPPDSPGAQKLYCTVNFVNDGNAPTTNISISVEMPPMIDMNSAFDELLQLHPALQLQSTGEVTKEIKGRTVTWHLKNFMLYSSSEKGEGAPSTYGFISFTMLTLPGTDVSSIPEMQACIVFDRNDPVCTLGAKVTPLSMADALAKEINQVLECQDGCEMPPPSCPWWVWVLIALGLLLLILLIKWWYDNNQTA